MTAQLGPAPKIDLPGWVPEAARNYLAHTENGLSIRALARANACHPSTVLRQVRRFEGRRDDPLIDAALRDLSARVSARDIIAGERSRPAPCQSRATAPAAPSQDHVEQEARQILRRMSEPGAVLAVARGMDSSVVVRQTEDGAQLRTAVVSGPIAQAMALKDWITCPDPDARVARYFVTNAGRAALRQLTAEDENKAAGLIAPPEATDDATAWPVADIAKSGRSAFRHYAAENPLIGLARRKDKDGKPFLPRDLVAVGERLREDFELVELSLGKITSIADFLPERRIASPVDATPGALAAHGRLMAALDDLGPGLCDIMLRCCCFLEGLEQTEKRMGWSARSGKIVLRIALLRLKQHYAKTQGKYGPMIG